MNKNIMNNRSKYLNVGMIFYVLIFFFGIGILGNVASTKAAPSVYLAPADTASPAVQPTVTPTPPPQPTPTPTPPPQPSPTPPPQPTPTSAPQPTPTARPTTAPPAKPGPGVTPVVPPPPVPNPGTGGDIPTTPTPAVTGTPKATVTATPTAARTPAVKTSTLPGQNTTNTPPTNPTGGTDTGGPNMLVLSLGIGTPVLLVFGGGLFWLYWRKNREDAASASSPWVSSNNMGTRNAFSQAPGVLAAPASPYAMNTLSANAGAVSMPNVLQQTTLPPFADLAGGPLYTPSDLRPITMALPQPSSNYLTSDPAAHPPTSDMNPLSFETLNLPHDINEMMKPQNALNAPIATGGMDMGAQFIPGSAQNSPAPLAAATQSIQPPDVTNDSMLEHVMRQAQLGLFVITNREQGSSQSA